MIRQIDIIQDQLTQRIELWTKKGDSTDLYQQGIIRGLEVAVKIIEKIEKGDLGACGINIPDVDCCIKANKKRIEVLNTFCLEVELPEAQCLLEKEEIAEIYLDLIKMLTDMMENLYSEEQPQ